MSTTVFITPFLKNAAPERLARASGVARRLITWCVALLLSLALMPSMAHAAEVTQLRVERGEDGVYLSAAVRFDLTPVVEDALLKGIPLFFVLETDIYRDRWYWTDPRVASAARTIRLAYQPLSRRWRVNIAAGLISASSGLRATLNQNYDTLPEAMAAIQQVVHWKVGELADVDADANHTFTFSFRLDLSQLPRPFQIGMAGQKEWNIAVVHNGPLRLEAPTPVPAEAPR